MSNSTGPKTLDQLYDLLKIGPTNSEDFAREYGLPVAHGRVDLTSLPTFGGDEPNDSLGIWSWDATRLLVGESQNDLRIVLRSEFVS